MFPIAEVDSNATMETVARVKVVFSILEQEQCAQCPQRSVQVTGEEMDFFQQVMDPVYKPYITFTSLVIFLFSGNDHIILSSFIPPFVSL